MVHSLYAFQIEQAPALVSFPTFFWFCCCYSMTLLFKTRPKYHMSRGLSSPRPARMCFFPPLFLWGRNMPQEKNPKSKEKFVVFVFDTFNCVLGWQLFAWAPEQCPQKDPVLSLNNKPAALWIKPSISVSSIFYVVLINTLTVICIKMADSCSKPASICPMHRGGYWICRCTGKYSWMSEWDQVLTWEET